MCTVLVESAAAYGEIIYIPSPTQSLIPVEVAGPAVH